VAVPLWCSGWLWRALPSATLLGLITASAPAAARHRGSAVAGAGARRVSSPLAVGIFSLIGLRCWGLPGADFQRLQPLLCLGEGWYQRSLAWVLAHRLLINGRLVGGNRLNGALHRSLGFVPHEDQG